MIHNKKEFGLGFVLMIGFVVAFAVIMSPMFKGQNALDYLDGLYNAISKDACYYIPAMRQQAEPMQGKQMTVTMKMENEAQAGRLVKLIGSSGKAKAEVSGPTVKMTGDLGAVLLTSLVDADAMYKNNGQEVSGRHGYDARQVMYDWWTAMKEMVKDLNKQQAFSESIAIGKIQTRGLEPAYNYYGITTQNIKSQLLTVVISLAGYVIYTVWYGFALLFMFEGWGLKLEH
ncbi:MAG: hypothetical protein AB1634_18065 [Thermodesulfobacteriota bacterium]